MVKLRKSGKGYLIKFTNWESWKGAGDPFELAITPQEMRAMYLLLCKHFYKKIEWSKIPKLNLKK